MLLSVDNAFDPNTQKVTFQEQLAIFLKHKRENETAGRKKRKRKGSSGGGWGEEWEEIFQNCKRTCSILRANFRND